MGAKERKDAVKRGEALLTQIEVLSALLYDLEATAQEIVDDFEDTRDNLSDREGLLQAWEDDHGYKSESWDTVVSEIEDLRGTLDGLTDIWNQGER